MKQIYTSILIFAGTLTSIAAPNLMERSITRYARPAVANKIAPIKAKEHRNYLLPTPENNAVTRAANVTVNFSQPEGNDFDMKLAVGIDNHTGTVAYYGEGDDWQTAELQPSDYTFLFWAEEADEPYAYHILADENVSISEDTEYSVDFKKCTEEVVFQAKLKDGSIAKCPLENFDTETIIEEGNLRSGWWSLFVFIDDLLIDISRGSMDRGMYDDGWSFDEETLGNVFVNEGLTRISLLQHRMLCGDEDNDGTYYTTIAAIPAKGGVYCNDPADYAYVNAPAVISSAGKEAPFDYANCNYNVIYQGSSIYELGIWNRSGFLPATNNYYVGSNDPCSQLGISFYSSTGRIIAEGLDFSSGDDNPLGIQSHIMENVNGEVQFLGNINAMNTPGNLSSYNAFKRGQGGIGVWTVNPWLDFYSSKTKIEDGNSTPVLVAQQCWYTKAEAEANGIRNTILHSFNGRNGEVRTIDFLGQTINVSLDGTPQDISAYPALSKYLTSMTGKGNIWDIEITDNNVVVNGKKGYNKTQIHFNSNADDVWAPTLQTLRTIDSDGIITDHFNSPKDGSLLIYGGDFECHYNGNNGIEWFSVNECNIKVEYAVTGSDKWNELKATVNPEKYMMPGWGYCWEASLSAIPGQGTDTSYDLRITLMDNSENYQIQTLSPVFTIAAQSGISEIYKSENLGNSTFFNLQGMEIEAPKPGIIYIERNSNGASRKVIIR